MQHNIFIITTTGACTRIPYLYIYIHAHTHMHAHTQTHTHTHTHTHIPVISKLENRAEHRLEAIALCVMILMGISDEIFSQRTSMYKIYNIFCIICMYCMKT